MFFYSEAFLIYYHFCLNTYLKIIIPDFPEISQENLKRKSTVHEPTVNNDDKNKQNKKVIVLMVQTT